MKNYTLIVLVISLFIFSCKKDYKPNINSTISGRFYDSVNKEPYPNLNLVVNEYQSHFNGYGNEYNLVSQLATGVTDANGNYSINFSTMGKGNYISLEWGATPRDVSIIGNSKILPTGSNQVSLINNIGGSNIYNAKVSKQYYMQIRVIVHNNPSPYVFLNATFSIFDYGGPLVNGANNDTLITVEIVKNDNPFSLTFGIPSSQPKTGAYFSQPFMLNLVVNQDTVQGGTFNIFPATFK